MSGSTSDIIGILKPWAHKPAGLLQQAHAIMNIYKDYAVDGAFTDEDRLKASRDCAYTIGYISAAKNCLTTEVKTVLAETLCGWNPKSLTKKLAMEFVEAGSNMTEKEFDKYMEEEISLLGSRTIKSFLYVWFTHVRLFSFEIVGL